MPVDTTVANATVGDGTAASCHENALDAALATAGIITFNCGAAPVVIPITSEKVITADTVLDGGGLITLDGGGTTRILAIHNSFDQPGPFLTVQNLAFTGGQSTGTSIPLGVDTDGGGGAIYHLGGTVTVIDCELYDNHAPSEGPDVAGGAIYGIGVGETIITGSTFWGNSAANGGAIGSLHTALTIVNSTIENNEATGYGANSVDPGTGMQVGHGGNGGAISMDGVGRDLIICGAELRNNLGNAIGGAVFRTSYENEPTVIDLSTFDGNAVNDHLDKMGNTSLAGGLYLQGSTVTITGTTISNNTATSVGGLWITDHGPGAGGSLTATNVTLADNSVYTHAIGETGLAAGLWVGGNATATLLNVTIAFNWAQFGSGITGIERVTMNNTVIVNSAQNTWVPINCTNLPPDTGGSAGGADNMQWPIVNSAGPDFPCATGVVYADPLLGALGDNGGPTWTVAPMTGSPAIGAGTGCPVTDQRGMPRSEPCTLGAYEP